MLFVGIGASAAVVCTVIYSLPPIIRIAGYGIRNVSTTTIEATDASGQSPFQRLRKVQLPMARKTIVVGVNQSIMCALSMATIAAFVDGPGLGGPVLSALTRIDVGGAFVPGMLLVVMAVMLDRTHDRGQRGVGEGGPRRHQPRGCAGSCSRSPRVPVVVAVYLSRQQFRYAEFPETYVGPDARRLGRLVHRVVHRHLPGRHRAGSRTSSATSC